uniref:Uncharacterized protein n=1 Tax=Oryza sativa subsp. japonica TaxID=39947 RepID=Q6ZI87_ORYSJ|nr:hypothetical protein [Oryza sativa Japonica Group]
MVGSPNGKPTSFGSSHYFYPQCTKQKMQENRKTIVPAHPRTREQETEKAAILFLQVNEMNRLRLIMGSKSACQQEQERDLSRVQSGA